MQRKCYGPIVIKNVYLIVTFLENTSKMVKLFKGCFLSSNLLSETFHPLIACVTIVLLVTKHTHLYSTFAKHVHCVVGNHHVDKLHVSEKKLSSRKKHTQQRLVLF
jgi:hypothetical protein